MTITEQNTCFHDYTTNHEGFEVCRWCGLINEEVREFKDVLYKNKIKEYSNHEVLGSFFSTTNYFKDHKKRIHTTTPSFKRISNLSYLEYTNREKVFIRNFEIGLKICKALEIPGQIIDACIYRFRKLYNNTEVTNGVLCFFYCIWETTRLFKYPLPLTIIIHEFKNRGHRVSNKRLNKAAKIYRNVLRSLNVLITTPLSVREYIGFYGSILMENHVKWQDSINKYEINIESVNFISEVISTAYMMYDTLNERGLIQGGYSIGIAAATLYAASLVLTRRYTIIKRKSVITQVSLSEVFEMWNSTIKENYLRYYKRFIIK